MTLYHADSAKLLPALGPAAVDVILTDPPWPNAPSGMFPMDPWTVWCAVVPSFSGILRLAGESSGRVIVVLGQDSDPRFLRPLSQDLPFLQVCWLERVPPKYRGCIMRTADIAYVFGPGWLSVPGTRILPAKAMTASRGKPPDPRENPHPAYRSLKHMRWLVHWYTRQYHLVLDPFAGSGTTGVACLQEGRPCILVELEERYCEIAARRLDRAAVEAVPEMYWERE